MPFYPKESAHQSSYSCALEFCIMYETSYDIKYEYRMFAAAATTDNDNDDDNSIHRQSKAICLDSHTGIEWLGNIFYTFS